MDVDLSADGLRYVVQIWLVPTGHDDVRETSTVGCKQLLHSRLAAAIHPSTCVASPSGRLQTTFSSHVRARSSGPASTWATSRSSDVLPVPAGAEITMTPRATARSSASRSRLRSGSGALHLCPVRAQLSSNHHAVRRRSVLYCVAHFGQGMLGSHRGARALKRRAAYAGSRASRMSF